MITDIRCAAPHPDFPGLTCRAKLCTVFGPATTVRVGVESQPGCLTINCPRCGTPNVICPKEQEAA